jgi:hypothetical protein
MPTDLQWEHARLILAIVLGSVVLVLGIRWSEPAMMTIGAGLVGFSPAAAGPPSKEPEPEVA